MRVIRQSTPASPSANSIREPNGDREVYRLAYSLNQVPNSDASGGRSPIASVPAGTIGRAQERRSYVRVRLGLTLRVQRVAGQRDTIERVLRTEDISSSGVYFLSPHSIDPGTPIELELLVVDRPMGPGSVRMRAQAHVVRAGRAPRDGWHGVAAAFDDIRFFRDERLTQQSQAG